jgi:hypothetical protein
LIDAMSQQNPQEPPVRMDPNMGSSQVGRFIQAPGERDALVARGMSALQPKLRFGRWQVSGGA